jgi:hypothetical protein
MMHLCPKCRAVLTYDVSIFILFILWFTHRDNSTMPSKLKSPSHSISQTPKSQASPKLSCAAR